MGWKCGSVLDKHRGQRVGKSSDTQNGSENPVWRGNGSPETQNDFWKLPPEREVQNCSPWLSVADEWVSGGAAGRHQGFGANSAGKSKTQGSADLLMLQQLH